MTATVTGKTLTTIHAETQARLMEQELTVRCALCERYERLGPASKVIRLIALHRARAHPELAGRRMVKRNRSFREQAAAARERERLEREAAAIMGEARSPRSDEAAA